MTIPPVDRESVAVTYPENHIAVITLRAQPMGVLSLAGRRGLLEHLRELEADPAVRVIVLTGSGKAFSVGSNIREFQQEPGWLLSLEQLENAVNDAIEGMGKPVIAALNGHALGGGMVLALACDMRIAARSIHVGVPEVKVGTFASGSGTQRLPRLIGRGRALYLLLTGRTLSAEEALGMGLVELVCDDALLMEQALEIAREIASMPPCAVEATKRCVNEGLRGGWDHGMLLEGHHAVKAGLSEAAAEGQRAFMEKRPPRFED